MVGNELYQAKKRVTLVGAALNVVLSVLKILVGWLAHSQALIADGLHSLSDLISDGMVLVAAKHGSRHADEDHPYGHERIETATTVALGLILIGLGVGVGYDAARRLMEPGLLLHPGAWALVVTILSILSKEALYHYTMHVAREVRSPMLKANAWHHRTDSISSVIVLVGVIGTMWGVVWLDAVAAIGVALMIAHVGWSLSRQGFNELVDKGLDAEKLAEVRQVITSVYGVRALHQLRSRRMGENALVDVHILVDPHLSVSEGHQISETVRARLVGEVDEVCDVTVHIDPEDDTDGSPNTRLPLRDSVEAGLYRRWAGVDAARHIQHLGLHYLAGKIAVDIYLPLQVLDNMADAELLAQRFAGLVKEEPHIGQVKVYYR